MVRAGVGIYILCNYFGVESLAGFVEGESCCPHGIVTKRVVGVKLIDWEGGPGEVSL